ncbi:MAG: hypothetical protein E6Q98_13790 [Rhodospirillaceae bacterium]|nr:MAG: hypothetical protein E6Q98_13790 [Rhodospirillaceae bacterium]
MLADDDTVTPNRFRIAVELPGKKMAGEALVFCDVALVPSKAVCPGMKSRSPRIFVLLFGFAAASHDKKREVQYF